MVRMVVEWENPSTWIMIELQGTVETLDQSSLNQRILGSLSQNIDQPTVSLVIGSHELIGRKVTLSPPFAVCEKLSSQQPSPENYSSPTSYRVAAVIREKYLFTSRPKPLVSSAGLEVSS